jgi:hypothetical protein
MLGLRRYLTWRAQTPYREKGSGYQPICELSHSPGFLVMDRGLFISGSAEPSNTMHEYLAS